MTTRRYAVAGGIVLIVLALITVLLVLSRTSDTSSGTSTTAATSSETGAGDAGDAGDAGGADDAGNGTSEPGSGSSGDADKPSPLPTATDWESLTIDEKTTDPDLVESAVCDLSGGTLVDRTVGLNKTGAFRDLIVITEERLADYRLAEDIDPRIKEALDLADRVVARWNRALYAYEAGRPVEAKRHLARADRLATKMAKVGTGDLCPTG